MRRFLLEARVTGQLEHPNIVPVYDLGSLPDGKPYYTMRIVKKQSLRDVSAQRRADRAVAPGATARRLRSSLSRARLRPLARRAARRHQAGQHPARRFRRGLSWRLGLGESRAEQSAQPPRQHESARLRPDSPRRAAARPAIWRPKSRAATGRKSITAPTCSRSASCSTSF